MPSSNYAMASNLVLFTGLPRLRIVSKDFDRVALNAYLTNNNVLAVIHPRIPDNRREAVGGLAMATARREARTQPFRSLGHPNHGHASNLPRQPKASHRRRWPTAKQTCTAPDFRQASTSTRARVDVSRPGASDDNVVSLVGLTARRFKRLCGRRQPLRALCLRTRRSHFVSN